MKHPILSLAAAAAAAFLHANVAHAGLKDDYKTAPHFYCADPANAAFEGSRALTALDPTKHAGVTAPALSQVHVMTRHGLRTTSRARKCWKGYDPTWECGSGERATGWLDPVDSTIHAVPFTKKYDARPAANMLKKNALCEIGQLVPTGHKQLDKVGKILAARYFGSSTQTENLFDLSAALTGDTAPTDLYFRSTDTQRTRMSGVQLLTSLAKTVNSAETDPKITLHTAEKESDSLRPNEKECYDLEVAKKEAYSSKEYNDTFLTKNKDARDLAHVLMGDGDWPYHVQDCLGVALCSGHDIPATADNVNWTKPNVEKMFNAGLEEFEWLFHANEARYSKIASAVVSYEFKASIVKHLCQTSLTSVDTLKTCAAKYFADAAETLAMAKYIKEDNPSIPNEKFIYTSAHETTIGPFLAAFGMAFVDKIKNQHVPDTQSTFIGLEKNFPTYASLMVFEIYTATPDDQFRFIYNGQRLTEHIPGCEPPKGEAAKDLCPVKKLFAAMKWATADLAKAPCKMKKPKGPTAGCPPVSSSVALAPFMLSVLAGLVAAQF